MFSWRDSAGQDRWLRVLGGVDPAAGERNRGWAVQVAGGCETCPAPGNGPVARRAGAARRPVRLLTPGRVALTALLLVVVGVLAWDSPAPVAPAAPAPPVGANVELPPPDSPLDPAPAAPGPTFAPTAAPAPPPTARPAGHTTVAVRRGDTLASVAGQLGVAPGALAAYLGRGQVYAGETVDVPVDGAGAPLLPTAVPPTPAPVPPTPAPPSYTGVTRPPFVPGYAPAAPALVGPPTPACPGGLTYTGVTRPPFVPGCAPAL